MYLFAPVHKIYSYFQETPFIWNLPIEPFITKEGMKIHFYNILPQKSEKKEFAKNLALFKNWKAKNREIDFTKKIFHSPRFWPL